LRRNILDAIQTGDTSSEGFANLELPESCRAVKVHKDEVDMFEGLTSKEKDPRKSLHVENVALPELGPGEAFVAVMAPSRRLPASGVGVLALAPEDGLGVRNPEKRAQHEEAIWSHVELVRVVPVTGDASDVVTRQSATTCRTTSRAGEGHRPPAPSRWTVQGRAPGARCRFSETIPVYPMRGRAPGSTCGRCG